MRLRPVSALGLVPVLGLLAVAAGLAPAGPADATTGTAYFGSDRSGNLIQVTVTGDQASAATVLRRGNPETEALSPAGSDSGVIVGLVADVDAGTTRLFTYDTAMKQFHDLSSLGHHIGSAAIYDNGARIAYSRATKHGYVIRSVPAAGGTPTKLFASTSWQPWDIAVSESGRNVYVAASQAVRIAGQPNSDTHRSGVFRITVNGKKSLEKVVADPLYYTQVQLSPDGKSLSVVRQRLSGGARSMLTVVNLSTGHVRTVLRTYANPIAGLAWAADGSSLVFRDATSWGRLGLHGRIDAIAKTAKLAFPVLASV